MSTPALRSSGGGLVPTRLNRQLGRVEHHAVVAAHKVRAVHFVSTVALQSALQLSQTQAELARLMPESELRLAAIGDAATAAMQATIINLGLEL